MTSKYKEYLEEFCPQSTLKEWFINYYGEEKQENIEKVFQQTPVIFIPRNMFSNELAIAFKKVYKSEDPFDMRAENEFKNFQKNFSNLEVWFQYADVFKEIGFDLNEIIIKDEQTGKFKFAQNENVEKLKNYCQFSTKKSQVDKNVVDIKFLEKQYNSLIDNHLLDYYNGLEVTFSEETSKYQFDLKGKTFADDSFNVYAKMAELDEKDEKFLMDLILAKGKIFKWKDEYSKYVIKGINKIFKRNHQTLEDIKNDTSLSLFRQVLEDISSKVEDMIVRKNVNAEDFVPSQEYLEFFNEQNAYFINNKNAAATFNFVKGTINIPIKANINISTVVHEYNHALSQMFGKDFDSFSTGFNEIVNEFLTTQVLSKAGLESVVEDCFYTNGINFMQDFLKTYEPILKECQFSNAEKTLKDFIGEENFNNLIEIGEMLEKCNYGNSIVKLIGSRKGENESLYNIFKEYEKDPSIINDMPPGAIENLKYFVASRLFFNDMITHFNDFKNGNIINIDADYSEIYLL